MTRPEQPQPYPGDLQATAADDLFGDPPGVTQPAPYPGDPAGTVAPAVIAQPAPYPGDSAHPGAVAYRRTYRDVLNRSMSGTATIEGAIRSDRGATILVAAPVTVTVTDGVLEAYLPPGEYTVTASLRTVDFARVTDVDLITLPHPA